MDDQDSGLIPKKADSDRSNAFHMLPHTIEDICTRQSMSTSANTNLYCSPIRHALPQIPTRSSTLRMAISKQTHREICVASVLGNKQESSVGSGHQLDLSARDRSAGVNSDESQDQLSLDAGELMPGWKEPQRNEVEGQGQDREQDLNASFQHHRQDQQESSVESNIATSGFHSSSSSASSSSNIGPFMMNSEAHHLDQHLSQFSPAGKEGEVHGTGRSSEFVQKISGINLVSRYDRNSPQMSSLSNFGNSQASWGFEFGKGYNNQTNEVVALEQVIQKVQNNPMGTSVLQSQHVQAPGRTFDSSPNPIKLKIRRDIGAMEQQQQQQQLHHGPRPLQQQPPQMTPPPPSHMSHGKMMHSGHQMPMDYQVHQQQQQHSYVYDNPRYVQSQGPKDYYMAGGGNGPENAGQSGQAVRYPRDDYQDPSSRHVSPYSPEGSMQGMSSSFPPGQLQHAHYHHNQQQQQQQQMMNQQQQQLQQHQHQYQHYQHHVAPPPPPQTASTLAHRSSTPFSSAMMVLHGATPSPPIFNCPPQGQQAPLPLQPAPSPSSAAARPKTGRAKTNAELKKQLMEKRAGQQVRASGDGSSLASSPSPSQIEVSSPRSISSPRSDSSLGGFQEVPVNFNGMEGQLPLQPSQAQYVELTKEDMEKSNLSWQPGDLVWARVAGHPWWPAMVASEPVTRQFVKLAPRGQKSQYHMQFFGEEQERSWVIESSAMTFAGKAAFRDFCQARLQDNKKDRKMYKIPSQHKKSWEASVRSAERAAAMSRQERFARMATLFLPEYKSKRSAGKRVEDNNKRKSRSDRSSSSDKFAKRSRTEPDVVLIGASPEKTDEDLPREDGRDRGGGCCPGESSHIVLPKNVSNQHQAQFTVFCRKRREAVALENPGWTPADVDAHLWQQWSRLDDETKSRFIPMGSDFTYLSRMMQNVDVGGGGGGGGAIADASIKSQAVVAVVGGVGGGGGGKLNGFSGEVPPSRIVVPKNMKAEETRGRKKAGASNASKNTGSHKHESFKSDEAQSNPQLVDEVCFICEKPDLNVVQCGGPCRGLFHRECIGLPLPPPSAGKKQMFGQPGDAPSEVSEEIICPQCRSKTHKCCECGELLKFTEATTVLCSVTDCGRFYHRACVDIKFFKTPDKLVCPLHSCLTCRVRNKVKDSELILADEEDLDFYECIRCPSAFHIPGTCLATGSKYLAGPFVVCSRHFSPTPKTHPLHARFGVSWCFTCEKSGGHMLNCESCPAAHHPSCLKITTNPSDLNGWQCPDCIAGINPLHGDVVWVKFGSYRWWPAQIYWPYEVPQNIAELPHEVGEFPVCFFGSRDYLWLNRRRVFPFKAGDRCCKEALRKSGGKVFDKAIREAIATFKALKTDPSSTVCATSNIIHLERNLSLVKPVVTNDDDDDDDDEYCEEGRIANGGKAKRKKKKPKDHQEKVKRASKPTKRARGARDAVKDLAKSDSEKQADQGEEQTEDRGEVAEADGMEFPAVYTVRSPGTFLSPQIEKDLSDMRALLKKKKPVEPPLWGKKSLPGTSRSTRKSGKDKLKGNDSSFLSTPSSVVSTLINRPLLQSTSLPGLHDTVCFWCGLEGQSTSESDDDDDDSRENCFPMGEKLFDGFAEKTTVTTKEKVSADAHSRCSETLAGHVKEEMTKDDDGDVVDVVKMELSQSKVEGKDEFKSENVDQILSSPKLEETIKCENEDDKQCIQNSERGGGDDENRHLTLEGQKNEGTKDEEPMTAPYLNEEDDNNNNSLKAAVRSRNNSETAFDGVKVPGREMVPSAEIGNSGFRKRGRLVFCDKVKCSKVYHYKCLRLSKMPHGHWLCPLHQCTICGRASTHQCSKCPNAFCLEHFPHCLSYMDDGSPICTGHPEAPPISEELVADILEEMALTRELELGHSMGSLGHKKVSDDKGTEKAKAKRRKRSLSASSSSSSSVERKKSLKKVKRKKPPEPKDVSFEKRILPSRTQSRERRFLENDSDEEKKNQPMESSPLAPRVKVDPVEPIQPSKEKRPIVKGGEASLKKDLKDKKAREDKEGRGTKTREEKPTTDGASKSPRSTVDSVSRRGEVADGPHQRSMKKRNLDGIKKLDKVKKSKDDDRKKGDDGSPKVKKKKKKDSKSEGIILRHSSKDERQELKARNQQQQQETSNPGEASGRNSICPPRTLPEIDPPVVKPSSLLPPPSSPDKSPMFDNSDDEFPELVIDVPM